MGLFEPVIGATPIDDLSDLIPTHILTRAELNEWEAANIAQAIKQHLNNSKETKITINWIKKIHRDMFDATWRWAGIFRQKNYNLGVDWKMIQEQLKILVDDIQHWSQVASKLELLQQSVRIHHRLVKIHPFVNGNGRHARLIADIFLLMHEHELPVWPSNQLIETTDIREKYILALQAADKSDYSPLENFTRKLM